MICILCDRPFQPDKFTEKKIKKHPHRIQICPGCHQRITEQATRRKRQTALSTPFHAADLKPDQSSKD
ncbi:DUF2197 domain-containing protein [Laceyella putida]|uniref:DUF2197 domain-containing protein n=1 Tax=Laceyella putida TaxID=110101 RepID=UPI00363695D6